MGLKMTVDVGKPSNQSSHLKGCLRMKTFLFLKVCVSLCSLPWSLLTLQEPALHHLPAAFPLSLMSNLLLLICTPDIK